MHKPSAELIAALDVDTLDQAVSNASLIGKCRYVKIGKQLFTRCGPEVVGKVQAIDKRVFLDLKFHDIPNTVGRAARAAADLGAAFITVHATGGRRMVEAARNAVEGTDTRVLAVTVLTSLSDEMLRDELGLHETAEEAVPRLAKLAVDAGAHGVVCSPLETRTVRAAAPAETLIVNPGVRPEWAGKNDQARVMTPREAADAGANFIVVGRPIFGRQNPAEAVEAILRELRE